MLAPNYKQGMEMMYSDLARVTRFVKPEPIDAEDIGSAEVAKQMNEGAYRAYANPWGEEDVIAVAAKGYDQRPNRERVQKMTRGFLKRVFGSTLWGRRSSCAASAWRCMTRSSCWTI